MAVGDVTLTKVGVYFDTTVAAGGTGQNLGNIGLLSGARLVYVPMKDGQILILKEVVAQA